MVMEVPTLGENIWNRIFLLHIAPRRPPAMIPARNPVE